MRLLSRVLSTAVAVLLGCAAVAAAGQSSPKPPANDDCLACHGDPDVKRANGTRVAVDAPALAKSMHGPMACVDCHAGHRHIRGQAGSESAHELAPIDVEAVRQDEHVAQARLGGQLPCKLGTCGLA